MEASSRGANSLMDLPSMRISPLWKGTMPKVVLMRVDLPQPFAPTIPTILFSWERSVVPVRISFPPSFTAIFSYSMVIFCCLRTRS